MVTTTGQVVQSFALEGKHPVYYFPDCNLLTLDPEFPSKVSKKDGFQSTLFSYFLGIRKLTALRQVRKAPESLCVEPWRKCNLACTYCYAESDPSYTKKVDVEQLERLLKKYPFKRVSVFGGEPLLDTAFLLKLKNTLKWEEFFFSTNGILLKTKPAQELIAQPHTRFQISLEPQEWSCRVAADGTKQINLIQGQLKSLRDLNPTIRVTIPPEAPYLPIRQFVDGLAEAIGSWKFSVSYWPASAPAPVPWLSDWIKESYELIRDDHDEKYRGKLPATSPGQYFHVHSKDGFQFYNCSAAYGSVSIGPDNRLHGCHGLAVVESDEDVLSSSKDAQEIDETKRPSLAYRWSNGMKPATCGQCSARYVCGWVCFIMDTPNSGCHFIKAMLPLALTAMVKYSPKDIMAMTSRSEERFSQLLPKMEKMGKEVNSVKWRKLVSGELALAEAAELAERLLGG